MTFKEFKELLEDFDFKVDKCTDGDWYVFFKNESVAHFHHESMIFLTNEFYKLSDKRKGKVLLAYGRYLEELPEKK